MNTSYDDIIHLPCPSSKNHPKMSLLNRAAQFAPFAALTGYEASIIEMKRETDEKIVLDEDAIFELEFKLNQLLENADQNPFVTITYFIADRIKEGGEYVTMTEQIKKYDELKQKLIFINNEKIAIENIVNIESSLFDDFL